MINTNIAITFDVDMVNYIECQSEFNEMENCFPVIREVLQDFPQVRTTWFIRIDSQIETLFGRADYIDRKSVV